MSSDKAATKNWLTQERAEAIKRLLDDGHLLMSVLAQANVCHQAWYRWKRLDATRDELTRELMRRYNLSDKQVVTIKRIAFEALTNQQLADLEAMSLTGMKTRMTEIFKKVGVKSRPQLIVKLHQVQADVIRKHAQVSPLSEKKSG